MFGILSTIFLSSIEMVIFIMKEIGRTKKNGLLTKKMRRLYEDASIGWEEFEDNDEDGDLQTIPHEKKIQTSLHDMSRWLLTYSI